MNGTHAVEPDEVWHKSRQDAAGADATRDLNYGKVARIQLKSKASWRGEMQNCLWKQFWSPPGRDAMLRKYRGAALDGKLRSTC